MQDMRGLRLIMSYARTKGIGHPTCSMFAYVKSGHRLTYQPTRVYFNPTQYEMFKPFPVNDNDFVKLA